MEIIKKKERKQRKLEARFRDGILFHLDLEKTQTLYENCTPNPHYGMLGISMNERKLFTQEEWTQFYLEGMKMFEEFKRVIK